MPKGLVTPDTVLVLVNAIYFKGDWAVPFDAKRTKQEDFPAPSGATSTVQMMRNHNLAGGRSVGEEAALARGLLGGFPPPEPTLEVLGDDLVERCLLGAATLVAARRRGAGMRPA